MTRVAICTVTHGSAAHLTGYFRALDALERGTLACELVIADCGSDDGSAERARALASELPFPARVEALGENRGFAGGMNAALAVAGDVDFVLSLNPDARPAADALERLVRCHRQLHTEAFPVAAVTGRLARPATPGEPARLDACGMRLRPSWRHLDRGSDQVDRGQLVRREEVFGGTGAATLFLGAALSDVAVGDEVFDAAFHSFREDAELCFRLRERGWHVVYEPGARFEHHRTNLPRLRAQMTDAVNFHSLKNRYLLRLLHDTAASFLLTAPVALPREIGILAYVVWRERSSLRAYSWLWRHRRGILERRRLLRARRTASAAALATWFWRDGRPLPQTAAAAASHDAADGG